MWTSEHYAHVIIEHLTPKPLNCINLCVYVLNLSIAFLEITYLEVSTDSILNVSFLLIASCLYMEWKETNSVVLSNNRMLETPVMKLF